MRFFWATLYVVSLELRSSPWSTETFHTILHVYVRQALLWKWTNNGAQTEKKTWVLSPAQISLSLHTAVVVVMCWWCPYCDCFSNTLTSQLISDINSVDNILTTHIHFIIHVNELKVVMDVNSIYMWICQYSIELATKVDPKWFSLCPKAPLVTQMRHRNPRGDKNKEVRGGDKVIFLF